MAPSTNKPGRRNYGPRAGRTVRYPAAYDQVFERLADEAGIPVSSWLAMAVSKQAGLDVPDYVQDELRRAAQERAARALEQEIDMLDMPKSA